MSDLFPITREDMAREAERELAMRERVYPRMVCDGRMKAHQAERQIAVMAAMVEVFRKWAAETAA
jgi:hypothetical protein